MKKLSSFSPDIIINDEGERISFHQKIGKIVMAI